MAARKVNHGFKAILKRDVLHKELKHYWNRNNIKGRMSEMELYRRLQTKYKLDITYKTFGAACRGFLDTWDTTVALMICNYLDVPFEHLFTLVPHNRKDI